MRGFFGDKPILVINLYFVVFRLEQCETITVFLICSGCLHAHESQYFPPKCCIRPSSIRVLSPHKLRRTRPQAKCRWCIGRVPIFV